MYHIRQNPLLADDELESLNRLLGREAGDPASVTRNRLREFSWHRGNCLFVVTALDAFPLRHLRGDIIGFVTVVQKDSLASLNCEVPDARLHPDVLAFTDDSIAHRISSALIRVIGIAVREWDLKFAEITEAIALNLGLVSERDESSSVVELSRAA